MRLEKDDLLRTLWRADLFWDIEKIKEIIQKADKEMLEYKDAGIGHTSLTLAALRERIDVVEMLIEAGSDVNAKIYNGETPLYMALEAKRFNLFSLLLKNGANPNVILDKMPILIHAIIFDLPEKYALELIKYGADINAKKINKETALMLAIERGHTKVAEKLIQKGARLNSVSELGDTALTIAVSKKDMKTIQSLIKESEKRKVGEKIQINKRLKRDTALNISFYSEYYDIFHLLIENGANINLTDQKGRSIVDFINGDEKLNFLKKYEKKLKGNVLDKYKAKRMKSLF